MCRCTARGIPIVTRRIIIPLSHINAIDIGLRSYPSSFRENWFFQPLDFSVILDLVSLFARHFELPSDSPRFHVLGFCSFRYLIVSANRNACTHLRVKRSSATITNDCILIDGRRQHVRNCEMRSRERRSEDGKEEEEEETFSRIHRSFCISKISRKISRALRKFICRANVPLVRVYEPQLALISAQNETTLSRAQVYEFTLIRRFKNFKRCEGTRPEERAYVADQPGKMQPCGIHVLPRFPRCGE